MLGTSPCDQMGANFDALFQSKQKNPQETDEVTCRLRALRAWQHAAWDPVASTQRLSLAMRVWRVVPCLPCAHAQVAKVARYSLKLQGLAQPSFRSRQLSSCACASCCASLSDPRARRCRCLLVVQEKRASAWGRDGCHGEYKSTNHVVLTTHPRRGCPIKIQWGASNPAMRGKSATPASSPRILREQARIALGLRARCFAHVSQRKC